MEKILMGIAVVVALSILAMSCKDMGDDPAKPFSASLLSVSIGAGGQVTIDIEGGVPPYVISEAPDSALARAHFIDPALSPASLVVTAPASVPIGGTTEVRIRDSHRDDNIPADVLMQDDEIVIAITVAATPVLVASPPVVTVGLGQQVLVSISNGTPPYVITESAIDSIATAAFENANVTPATLVISGATAAGSTSVRIRDSSPLAQREVRVHISVTEAPPLTANPPLVSAEPGQQISVSISGGVTPYIIAEPPSPGISTAAFVDANAEPATLLVTGVASSGSTSIRILDSSPAPQHEVRIPISAVPTPPLSASPSSVTVGPGQAVNVSISNGSPPYLIATAPDPGLATASFVDGNVNPATLVITGVTIASASGSTSVRVTDKSSPQRQVTIPITKNP